MNDIIVLLLKIVNGKVNVYGEGFMKLSKRTEKKILKTLKYY